MQNLTAAAFAAPSASAGGNMQRLGAGSATEMVQYQGGPEPDATASGQQSDTAWTIGGWFKLLPSQHMPAEEAVSTADPSAMPPPIQWAAELSVFDATGCAFSLSFTKPPATQVRVAKLWCRALPGRRGEG